MTIPLLDLKGINERYRIEHIRAFERFLDSGRYILGVETEKFEEDFARYCGINSAIGVGNGLEALTLVLKAWGIGPGDEVIVPTNTYIATWLAVSAVGAKIVPVEPCVDSFNIDPKKIEDKVSRKTKVIIPVHLYGELCDMDRILKIASLNKLLVLEDAAQAHGAVRNGKRSGSWGDASAFSFYPGKNLGALGDGGAITTSDIKLATTLKKLRNYGSDKKYIHELSGINSRLDELQSAFLSLKLKQLDSDNSIRKSIAKRYCEGIDTNNGVVLPNFVEDGSHVWHLYVIKHDKRDAIRAALGLMGIETGIHYPIPPHLQKAYADLPFNEGDFPISEKLHKTVLSLPISPVMSDESVEMVISKLNKILRSV